MSSLKFYPSIKVLAPAATVLSRSVSSLTKTNHVLDPFFSNYKNNKTNSIRKNPYVSN